MAWTGLTLTVDGRNALNQAQLANEINFKSIVVGDGDVPNNFSTQKALVHQLFEITDIKIDVTDSGCSITADFPTAVDDYYFREVGVIVSTADGDKLYVYDNCGDDAQLIVVSTGVESTKKRIRLSLAISSVSEINVTEPGILYVSYEDFELAMKNKVDQVEGKGLSSNDYTDDEKQKLSGIADGANNYTHPETHPAEMIEQDSGHRMVTDAEKAAWDVTYQQATAYVDSAIADLINGAPDTLDTLKEIADAMAQNESVVEALDQAIGTKASQAELDTHTGNGTIHITASERTKWNGAVTKAQQNAAAVEQLNTDVAGKQEEITGAASSIASSNLTASRALVSNSAGKVAVSAVTSTELGCLAGVTSNVQSQLNGKQAKLTNPLTQSDVVNNLTSTETKKPLSANQGKILNDKISQKSRLYVQLVTITGNGSNWIIVNSAGKYLVAAQTIREDTDYYVTGINKQNADGLYTLLFNRDVSDRTTLATWLTWMD